MSQINTKFRKIIKYQYLTTQFILNIQNGNMKTPIKTNLFHFQRYLQNIRKSKNPTQYLNKAESFWITGLVFSNSLIFGHTFTIAIEVENQFPILQIFFSYLE